MPRHSTRIVTASLAATALVGTLQAGPGALAAPAPSTPAPAAPSQGLPTRPNSAPDPSSVQLPMAASTETVTVDGTPRRVLASLAPTDQSFTMAGITFASLKGSATFQVRNRTADGWQPWHTFDIEPDGVSATDRHGARQGTDADWFDTSTAVEARILTSPTGPASVTAPKLSLIDSDQLTSDANLGAAAQQAATQQARGTRTMTAAAAGATYATAPAIITRSQWGADPALLSWNGASCVPANVDTTIKAAIVHHTAGSNSYTAAQSASIVRGIYAYHVKDKGWCDIGYNFLVDKYGQVFEGRHGGVDNPVHGAHATYWNTDTVGVSVMMDSSAAAPTTASMSSLTKVLAWKLAGNYRDPKSTLTLAGKTINRIARHGDVMQTSCPGTNITAYMPTLRNQVAAAMGTWKTPIYTAWQAQGGEGGALGSPHVLERAWNGGRTTTFTGGGIYQDTAGRTFWMSSAASNRYLASGAFTALGWPTANQATGTSAGTSLVRFQKGTIYASAATGAHATTGEVDAWLRSHPADLARLGYPTGEAVAASSTSGSQAFAHGRLVWSGSTVSTQYAGAGRGDLNGDGRADLVSVDANGVLTWRPTQADLTSGDPQTGTTLVGQPFSWISTTDDLNADGQPDLLAIRTDGTLWSWQGRGNGTFTDMRQIGRGWSGMREVTVVPDMTGDKLPEILAISKANQGLYRYSLSSTLTVKATVQIGRNWGGISHMTSVGDFRRVGVVDILGVAADGRLIDYFGTKAGAISGSKQVGSGWNGFSQVRSLGDVNGDGRWDLVTNRASGPLYLYVNRGGSWAGAVAMLPEVSGLGVMA